MSLLPLLFEDVDVRPVRRNIATSLLSPFLDEDLVNFRNHHQIRKYLELPDESISAVATKSDDFQASIDVQQFKPEEITVKLTDDNTITVEGKHEEREDEHGYISRHFVRKYVLPEEFDAGKLQSKLSSDGVLNIIAPKKPVGKQVEYKEIPITLTGPVKSLGPNKTQKKLKQKRLNKSRGPHSIN